MRPTEAGPNSTNWGKSHPAQSTTHPRQPAAQVGAAASGPRRWAVLGLPTCLNWRRAPPANGVSSNGDSCPRSFRGTPRAAVEGGSTTRFMFGLSVDVAGRSSTAPRGGKRLRNGIPHGARDRLNLLVSQLRIKGQREFFAGSSSEMGKSPSR